MNWHKLLIITGTLLTIKTFLFADRQVDLALYSTVYSMHMLTNSVLMQSDHWTNNGEVAAQIVATPSLSYEDNFQPDARIDAYISRSLDTNDINISIREAFVDLLFYDTLSLKTGFLKMDYGYNSYFHPLNIIEFVPDIRYLYNKINIGNQDLGYKGVPAFKVRAALPEFIDKLKISIEESMVWINFNDLSQNYYLSSITGAYLNYTMGLILGYSGNSFSSDTNRKLPVTGYSFSASLPYDFLFFIEGLYKKESYRPYSQDNIYTEKRGNTDFFDVSFRLQTQKEEPLFHNMFSMSLEYFYYGEGLTKDMYGNVYDFLKNPVNLAKYGQNLIVTERNFQNYIEAEFGYTLNGKNLTFGYDIWYEPISQLFKQQFSIQKTFNKVSLIGYLIYTQSGDEKYQLTYGGNDWSAFLNMIIEI